MKLIDKAAVMAEIERLKVHSEEAIQEFGREGYVDNVLFEQSKIRICETLLSSLNTIEVKEVDFEKIWKEYFKYRGDVATVNIKHLAKHFFELGMQASNPLTWEDIANINDIVSEMLKECRDIILYDTQESFCKEVLKRFKALKGESI